MVKNEQAQDKKIEFEFLKMERNALLPIWNQLYRVGVHGMVCYANDMVGTPEEG